MSAVFKKEFSGIFHRAWGYICVSLMVLVSSVTFIYYNLSYAAENILSVLSVMSVVTALILPVPAVNMFPNKKKENTDSCYDYLPLSSSDVVLGKYFASLSAVLLSNLPLVLFGVLSGAYAAVDHMVSYSALLALVLLEAALLAIYMFIAGCAKNRLIAYVICYSAAVVLYFAPMFSVLVPLKPIASFAAIAVLLLLAAAVLYAVTKKLILSAAVLAVCESLLAVAYFIFTPSFAGLFEKLINTFSLFGAYDSFVYGIFNIKSIVLFLLCACLFVFLTWRQAEAKNTRKEITKSLGSVRAVTLLTAIVLTVSAIAASLAVGALPNTALLYDATLSDKSSPSDEAGDFLATLDKEVTLYLLEPTGEVAYELYLERLVSKSDWLSLKRIYAEVTPEFYSERDISISAISANSLVIECGDRFYYVSYYNLFYYSNSTLGLSEMSNSQYQYYLSMFSQSEQYSDYLSELFYGTSMYFAADEIICSYIEYAAADILPTNYYLCGHGENSADDANSPYYGLGIEPLNIGDGDIPADAASILINIPTSDITDDERTKLSAYLSTGGQLTLLTNEANLDMPNLCALLAEYGLGAEKGSVKQDIDNDGVTETLTTLSSTANTDSYVLEYFADDTSYAPTVSDANAITINEDAKPYLTVTPLLSSPADCYITDSEVKGTYTLACSAETPDGAKLVWFTGGDSFNGDSQTNAMTVMCAISWVSLTFESNTDNIPSSLYSSPLTLISSTSTRFLSVLLIVLPIAICAIGMVRLYKRKCK